MPRRIPAAGCMVNSLSTNLSNQSKTIWISDALLTDTFQSFCHTSRRYGSHVPGPLEARRRASKRKNTSLAYVGGGQPLHDPAMILDSGSKQQWWTKSHETRIRSDHVFSADASQEQEHTSETSSLLPAWLVGATKPVKRFAREPQITSELSDQDLQIRLAQAIDLQSIQDLVAVTKLDLRRRPELCRFIFDHLIQIYGTTGRYAGLVPALRDPTLNPPGSSNHVLLLRHLCSNHLSRKSWDSLIFPAVLKAVELGLVSVQDIQEIIFLIPKIYERIPTPNSDQKIHAEWHRLLTAIEQSRIIHMDDFDARFLRLWYETIDNGSCTDTTCLLLWRLRQCSSQSELELASDLTIRRLHDFVQTDQEASTKLVNWLAALPLDLQGAVILHSTFQMLSSALNKDDPVDSNVLDKWSQMLPQLYSSDRAHEFPVDQSSWSQVSQASCGLTAPQQLLCVIWAATRLWAVRPNTTARFKNLGIRDQFERVFTNMEGAGQFDHVGKIVCVLDTLPLPHKDSIFPYLQHFSNQALIKMLGNEEYQDDLKACFRLDYAKLQDKTFVSRGRRSFPHVLTALSESINTDLQQFKAMSQTLILKNNDYFRIVSRLLDCNTELKLALARSWPNASTDRNVRETKPSIDPAAALTMIEQLVMTFAVTPAVSPRSAFRHVHRMYLFLHRVGAPINPVIARALWHTGVTRYGQTAASRAQLRWCLRKVREIEGKEVAHRLLWSAGFRNSFLGDYIHLLTEDNKPPELPEELPEELLEPRVHHENHEKRRLFRTTGSVESIED